MPRAAACLVLLAALGACAPGADPRPPGPTRVPLPALEQPSGTPLPRSRSRPAEAVEAYRTYCAACHGLDGAARDPAAAALRPPPPSFLDADYMRAQTPAWYYRAITEGVPGSAMPSWEFQLDEDLRWDLAFYTWSLATPAETLAQGGALYLSQCQVCHGADGRGVPTTPFDDPRRAALSRAAVAEALAKRHPEVLGQSPQARDALAAYLWAFLYEPGGGAPTPSAEDAGP